MEKVIEIFDDAQRSSSAGVRKSNIRKLQALVQTGTEAFMKAFIHFLQTICIDNILLVAKKEASVENTILFFSEFISAFNDNLFTTCMKHLLLRTSAVDKTVRFRSCQIISEVLSRMSPDVEIDSDLWKFVKLLTPRLRDKIATVRLWALRAVRRFQYQVNDSDLITEEIIHLMKCDTSISVRIAAIETVEISKRSLPSLLERIRDVNCEVRIAAFKKLLEVNFHQLNASYRATIIKYGLRDREINVKKAAIAIISEWIKTCQNRVPSLLHKLNLRENEEDSIFLAWKILESVNNEQIKIPELKKLIQEQRPTWEGSFAAMNASEIIWAKVRCDFAKAKYSPLVADDVIESLLPDMVVLCALLEDGHTTTLYDNIQQKLSMKYLLEVTSFLESSDVSGREKLTEICEAMILDVFFPEDLVKPLLEAWCRSVYEHEYNQSPEKSFDAAFKLAQTVTSQVNINDVDTSLSQTREERDEERLLSCIRSMELILWILTKLIQANAGIIPNFADSCPYFAFITSSIWSSIQQPDSELRCLAVRGLGLLGLCSESICGENYSLLFQVASNDMEENDIRCQAIQILSDFAMIYPSKFSNDASFCNVLHRLQGNSSDSITTRVALETSAKLFFSRLTCDPKLLSNLLKFFFLPEVFAIYFAAEEEDSGIQITDAFLGTSIRLQQILSVFFQTFFSFKRENANVIVQSIPELIPDLTMLIQSGDLSSVVLDKIISSVVSLHTRASDSFEANELATVIVDECNNLNAVLSANICREILKLGNTKLDKSLLKDLVRTYCSMAPESWISINTVDDVIKVSELIRSMCSDKSLVKAMDKFIQTCETFRENNEMDIMKEKEQGNGDVCIDGFFGFAPGLADLIEMNCNDERHIPLPTTAKAVTATSQKSSSTSVKTKKAKKVVGDQTKRNKRNGNNIIISSDVEDEEVEEQGSGPRRALSRSSKTAAAGKIVSQLSQHENEDENEDENVNDSSPMLVRRRRSSSGCPFGEL